MLLRIEHSTRLTYSSPVSETVFETRMAPPSTEDQTALSHGLSTTPAAPVTSYRDGFGNRVELFNVPTSYTELSIRATSLVRTHRRAGPLSMSQPWPRSEPPAIEALEFLQPSPLVVPCQALTDLAATLPAADRSLAALLDDLVALVRNRLVYESKVTSTRTSLSEVLRLGRGVCQDFSHLFLGLCRHFGLPARYVSGYVHHPGEMATHAWCQIWGGSGTGWIDIDPTSGVLVGDDHVVVAIGRDYADVTPNRGVWKGQAREDIDVVVTIEPVERVPLEWPDSTLAGRPRPVSSPTSRRPNIAAGNRGSFVAYPNQRPARLGLHQQQAEQQQQQEQQQARV